MCRHSCSAEARPHPLMRCSSCAPHRCMQRMPTSALPRLAPGTQRHTLCCDIRCTALRLVRWYATSMRRPLGTRRRHLDNGVFTDCVG